MMSADTWVRVAGAATLATALAGCTAAPRPVPAPAEPPAPVIPIERKAGWILRLEQQRILREEALGGDLTVLAKDQDAGVRRRSVLAIGRVGLAEGVPVAISGLSDGAEDVRATAAFALGLLGDARAVSSLEAALKDPSLLVRGRAAEALGLVGTSGAAAAIAEAASGCAVLIANIAPDDEEPKGQAEENCRL